MKIILVGNSHLSQEFNSFPTLKGVSGGFWGVNKYDLKILYNGVCQCLEHLDKSVTLFPNCTVFQNHT